MMAQYFADFSGLPDGPLPSSIVRIWDTTDATTIVGGCLSFRDSGNRRAIAYIPNAPKTSGVSEMYMRYYSTVAAGTIPMLVLRGTVASAAGATGYQALHHRDNTAFELRRRVGGAESVRFGNFTAPLLAETVYCMRVRVETEPTLVRFGAKVWATNTHEPGDFIALTDTAANRITSDGLFGFGAMGSSNTSGWVRIAAVGFGTDGDPAPTDALSPAGRKRHPLLMTPW
ncbi:hypothetical protein [Thauera sp.]|uniref:hypothetical protein n=1 Tax=Thauera sp. TaxID=1905334 RepID=UPI0039E381A7